MSAWLPAQTPETPPPEAPAQKTAEPPPTQAAPHFLVRRYPRDKDVAVAIVGSRSLTLGELIDHIDSKHFPGFRDAMPRPEIQRMLQSDLIAPWVRQFADLHALRLSLGEQAVDEKKLTEAQSADLKAKFQTWLDTYTANRRESGRTTELTQRLVNSLLADFQLRSGLACEVQGFLDYLEPDDYQRGEMQAFFNANARVFGGQVKVAHILVQHRDGGTGILLAEEGRARANQRLAEIRARLRPDGSNFEDVAARWSDDTRTAHEGGLLGGLHRFDDRMPATLCRAAWNLRDGEVSDVIETQYGWHICRRLDFNQQVFMLFTDDAMPTIRMVMRRSRQETRLFDARKAANVQLLL
ncbi:MAG TPA: peptidylprolyl isomerase [Planctomycetota bacterium]|nr:peptidylprolyl isomerase [Planctomycetota bacterium]